MPKSCYTTAIIFKINNQTNNESVLFDRQIRFLEALNAREAYQKTLSIASKELDYMNMHCLPHLNWEFVGIEYMQFIDNTEVGAVLHSSIEEPENPDAYIQELRKKNAAIEAQVTLTA